MGLFRKRNETYNQQMLREAGLDRVVFNEPEEPEPSPSADPPPFHSDRGGPLDRGLPRGWDAATTVTAPGLSGDSIRFITLSSGDVIIEEEEGDADVSALADAIEARTEPPYRAVASRQSGDLWGVGAKRIEVTQFSFPDGDELELTQTGGESELRVDGEASDAATPVELQRLGEREGDDFCVAATRIDGDFWEVRVSAL